MVVAHYPFPIVGGLEKQAHELSKFLVLKQVTVSVLSGKFANSQDSLEIIDGVTVHRIDWYKNRFFRFLALDYLDFHYWIDNDCGFFHFHTHC